VQSIRKGGQSQFSLFLLSNNMGELIVLKNATLEQEQQLEGYLANKWGLDLPRDHPEFNKYQKEILLINTEVLSLIKAITMDERETLEAMINSIDEESFELAVELINAQNGM
jgi:hypothetical protein